MKGSENSKKQRPLVMLALASLLLLCSCNTSRMCSDELKQAPLWGVPVLEPYTYVELVHNKSEEGAMATDSLTNVAHELLTNVIVDNGQLNPTVVRAGEALPTGEVVHMDDADAYEQIGRSLGSAVWACQSRRQAKKIELPAPLIDFMNAHDYPYLMLVYHEGYVRTKGNYARDMAIDVAAAVLATAVGVALGGGGGVYGAVPAKQGSSMIVAVADASTGKLAYFNRQTGDDVDPLSRSTLYRQLWRTLKRYPKLTDR